MSYVAFVIDTSIGGAGGGTMGSPSSSRISSVNSSHGMVISVSGIFGISLSDAMDTPDTKIIIKRERTPEIDLIPIFLFGPLLLILIGSRLFDPRHLLSRGRLFGYLFKLQYEVPKEE